MADAFTPRFVDLVRNFSTTMGTGNFALGAAVNGYSSFANALAVGDRFYYSAISVDKPAEREVGRGTLLANGMIAREAISGSKTNFSNGTKTISLIAAAEWFEAVQAGGNGPAGVGTAGTRAELAALVPDEKPVLLSERGCHGLFVFDASNVATRVAADSGRGIYVAPASDPTGASGAWVRQFDGCALATWFGLHVEADAAANSLAMTRALSACRALTIRHLHIPEGSYSLAETIDVAEGPMELSGSLPGPYASGGTTLHFTSDTTGIRVQGPGTAGASASNQATGGAEGTLIRNLSLRGAFAATESEAHGLHIRGKVTARELRIENFSGDGIHNRATFSGGNGNTNGSLFENIVVFGCRWATYSDGADANNCSFNNVSAFLNRRGGHLDSSFLGNVYRDGDISSNGAGTAFPTRCQHNGKEYIVRKGQEIWCASNAPSGTNAHNQGWAYCGDAGGLNGPMPTWAAGLTWYWGAPFAMDDDNNNARSRFENIYVEVGQGPCFATWPGLVTQGQQLVNVLNYDLSGFGIQIVPEYHRLAIPNLYSNAAMIDSLQVTADLLVQSSLRASQFWTANNASLTVLAQNGAGEAQMTSFNAAGNAVQPLHIASSQVRFRSQPLDWGGSAYATLDSSGFSHSGTISAANLSGTNTGDQFTNLTSARLVGRAAAGFGPAEQISLGAGLGLNAGALQVQFAATGKLHARFSTGGGATEEAGLANGLQFTSGNLGLGAITPASVLASGALSSSSPSSGVGYATGAGGAVTQPTNKSTGVTLNCASGTITMHNAALAAGAIVEFTVVNSAVAATDTVNLNLKSGAASSTAYRYWVSGVAAGSFKLCVENRSGGSLSEALAMNFALLKAVAA